MEELSDCTPLKWLEIEKGRGFRTLLDNNGLWTCVRVLFLPQIFRDTACSPVVFISNL